MTALTSLSDHYKIRGLRFHLEVGILLILRVTRNLGPYLDIPIIPLGISGYR